MKKIYFLLFVLMSAFSYHAQSQVKSFHHNKPINMQAILAKKPSITMGFSTISEARSIINDIMDVSDVQQNFRVEATTQVDNAAAVIYQNVRYILYNPAFINELDNAAKDKWASISVIGHEIGHHLLKHTLDSRGSQIPKELEADEYSGLVLRRMGASLQQAQLAMKLIASPYPSATHPGESDRLAAIARGWHSTNTQPGRSNAEVAIGVPGDRTNNYPNNYPPSYPSESRRGYPSGSNQRNDPSQTDERSDYPNNYPNRNRRRNNDQGTYGNVRSNVNLLRSVVYDINFIGNISQPYYVTTQNQVIMLRGNRALVVAKISATNNRNYPYVIFDDQQQILVDDRGNLFIENGRRQVGYITRHR